MAWSRTDDLDGSSPASQMTFGMDGKAYTIDLSTKNAERLMGALQPFLTVARIYGELPPVPVDAKDVAEHDGAPGRRLALAGSTKTRQTLQQQQAAPVAHRTIRVWANKNGHDVGPKGRIPDAVIRAYHEANPQ